MIKKRIVSLCLMFGVALAVWLTVANKEREKFEAEDYQRESRRLVSLDSPDDIAHFVLQNKHGRFSFVRGSSGEWESGAKTSAPLNASRVDALLHQLLLAESSRTSKDANPDDLGLAEPKYEIIVTDWAKNTQRVIFGSVNPFDKTLYAMRPPVRDVLSAPGSLQHVLSQDLHAWLDNHLFRWPEDSIHKLVLARDEATYTLLKKRFEYRIETPIEAALDPAQFGGMVEAIRGLRFKKLLAENPDSTARAPFNLDNPGLVITAYGRESSEVYGVELAESYKDSIRKLYAYVPHTRRMYEVVDDGAYGKLEPTLTSLIDTRLIRFESSSIRSIKLQRDQAHTVFSRSDTGSPWSLGADEPAVSAAAIKGLLYLLSGFVRSPKPMSKDGMKFSRTDSKFSISLRFFGERPDVILHFGTSEGKVIPVWLGDRTSPVWVGSDRFTDLSFVRKDYLRKN